MNSYKGRLARQQARLALITAVTLGIAAATVELFVEYYKTIDAFEHSMQQVVFLTEGPASIAALNLDQEYAKETLTGLSSFDLVAEATINDESDNTLYNYRSNTYSEQVHWLSDLLFGRLKEIQVPLRQSLRTEDDYIDVGSLKIVFDVYVGGREFIDRSLMSLLAGTIKNIIFVLALIYLFNRLITRPLLKIDNELNDIDLKDPGKSRIGRISIQRDDELTHLASSINNLLVKIDQYGKEEVDRATENQRLRIDIDNRKERERIGAEHKEQLEETNRKLLNAMGELVDTQNQLVAREKYASLGELVAGVAHELNTPIGIGITASSHITEQNAKIEALFESDGLSKSDLKNYMLHMKEAGLLIQSSLAGAAKLIESFKHVARDQTSEERQEFYIYKIIDDVYLSLDKSYKRNEHKIHVNCSHELLIDSFPSSFSQVFFHLMKNSFVHAFETSQVGEIFCNAYCENSNLVLLYEDNGKGMPEEQIKRIFDPFFSTSRTEGNTGLGGTIIHNIVTQDLKGLIECTRSTFGGLRYQIIIKQQADVMLFTGS